MRFNMLKNVVLLLLLSVLAAPVVNVSAWSNGGFSADPSNPDYGTHDWIAEHALNWLPNYEKQYILNNLAAYLYGTELPDNGQTPDGIGDTVKHHVYYDSSEVLTDDAAAIRASTEYNNTLNLLKSGDLTEAAKNAGIMSHYIVDVAVFGHVMGSDTEWGKEQHHSDYENYINGRTSSYDAEFNSFLSFDGSLTLISAYNATKDIAYDTTFDVDGDLTCVWTDQNYDWGDPTFLNRCGESLNLAVNYLADVLHTLHFEAHHGVAQIFNATWEKETYHIATFSNSTIWNFNFSQSFRQISFNVTGPEGTTGFCGVVIPKTLLKANETHPWTVLLDGKDITKESFLFENATHASIYFAYAHSMHKVQIVGTWVAPEFPLAIITPLLMIAAFIAAAIGITIYSIKRKK